MNILITGSSGYIGSLLIYSWLLSPKVNKIIAIDTEKPKFLSALGHPRLHFIKKDIADVDLNEIDDKIDAVVHTAYIIRKPYFRNDIERQEHSNLKGAENIFGFALKNNVKKLIHFSTVAVYGANPENSLERRFIESDPVKETKVAYGVDKAAIETKLENLVKALKSKTQVVLIRLGSVTGPFLKDAVKKSGLQSYLKVFPFVPVTSSVSARQFVHEEDVVRAINFCLETKTKDQYSILNLAPEDHLTFRDIAKLSNKVTIKIPKPIAELAFNLMWHLSLGKIPSAPGTINSYSYPILVDSSKISKLGFKYQYSSRDAFLA